jgi:O-antigen ligase
VLKLFEAGIVLGIAVGVAALFVRWEREGKEHLAPLVLLGLLVVEATIYGDPNAIPRGIFHPGSGSTQLRLPEVYITLALVARLIARGKPGRIGLPAGLWLAFGAWMTVGVGEGFLYHNVVSQNLYEAKDIIYIVGGYALAAGVPIRRYVDSGALFKLGTLSVACASILDVMSITHVRISFHLPLLPLQNFGLLGAETAALFIAIATLCFMCRLAAGPVRIKHVLALIPALVSLVLANQRAVLVNFVVLFVALLLVLIFGKRPGAVRRLHIRSGQVVLTVLAVVAAALAFVILPAAVDRQPPHIPLASTFQSLFHNEAKVQSAQDRLNLASEAEALIPKHLIIGWGLGMEFQFYEVGTRSVQEIPYAHDIVLDLWLRVGIIGLVLFVLAMTTSMVGGIQVWRRDPELLTAALALGLVAVLAGLFAQALLEPFIDEYRFAVLFGVTLGMLRAAVTSSEQWLRLPNWTEDTSLSTALTGGGRWR